MPLYEYFCPKCSTKFELLRPMSGGDDPATCPSGHKGGTRVLSMFAANVKGGTDGAALPAMGGGCACGGGGCGCGH